MPKMCWKICCLTFVLLLSSAGCVQRTLTVRTDPPGALVYLNDQEIGRSPVTRDFKWYGVYDVEIRLDGYESIKTTSGNSMIAPWWQWMPFDLLAELFPVTDHHEMSFTLRPPSDSNEEPDRIVKRAEQLRDELESSRHPTTKATTRPNKHPATRPKTQPTSQK